MPARELQIQLQSARRQILTDKYEMSFGEVVTLYRSKEIVIHPAYQRMFRWTESQQTRFVESLLLGLTVPTIYVAQNEDGTWDLLDGLHPVMTVLRLTGDLRDPEGRPVPSLVLEGTAYCPALEGMSWSGDVAEEDEEDDVDDERAFNIHLRLDLRRARIRVEILRFQSGESAKLNLFERFNLCAWPFDHAELQAATLALSESQATSRD